MNKQPSPQTQKSEIDATMRLVHVGTQAGIFDSRVVSGFLLDILQKLHEIHQNYQSCSDDLEKGRDNLNASERTMSTMQTALGTFTDTVDNLGVHLLQENATLANKHLALEKMRKDVALKRVHVAELSKNVACPKELRKREMRLYELKDERAKLELQLAKVNSDIDTAYEDMYNVQERMYGIKDLRESRRSDQNLLMENLKGKCNNMAAKKSQLLAITSPDTILDMRDIYVSSTQFTQLQADIDMLKHKQVLTERHVQMQLEEREFLHTTAKEICEKVYDLERKVRKETGDHGFESPRTAEPNWYQDLGNPTVWYTSPKLTLDQLKIMLERQSKEHRYRHAQTETEIPGTSAESDNENVITIEHIIESRL